MKKSNIIVMIDDDSEDHQIIELLISELDDTLEIIYFSTCEKATTHFGTPGAQQPLIVFIDINLPRNNGYECIGELQKLRRFDHPRIIVYSSVIPVVSKEKFREHGVDDFLEKTGDLNELKKKLRNIISN